MNAGELAAELAAVADYIDKALAIEYGDRQIIAEYAATRLRELAVKAAQLTSARPPAGRHAAVSSWVGPDGMVTLTHEDLLLVLGAVRTALDVAPTAQRFELAALRFRLGDDR